MSLEYLHHNIVPMGYLFTYDELSKILIDAAAFSQHGIAPPPVSAYSNKYRGKIKKGLKNSDRNRVSIN
uniref:Uncharacterized protein n=1 Tax=Panagrolaimus davidi TaxID=227884 RepID=A0A914QHM9_9BILA